MQAISPNASPVTKKILFIRSIFVFCDLCSYLQQSFLRRKTAFSMRNKELPILFSNIGYTGSAVKPASSTTFFTWSLSRFSVSTVNSFAGLAVSTFQDTISLFPFRCGVTAARQPPQLIFVLNLYVFIIMRLKAKITGMVLVAVTL